MSKQSKPWFDSQHGYAKSRLAGNTLSVRSMYLQLFAEAHGFRLIRDCTPLHMEQWLDDHREWRSDWTKNGAVRNVQVAFNWAVKKRLIPSNPFQGVTHRAGLPRRNMTPQEFGSILRACRSKGRKRPTPARRFRKVLIYLWLTGCRPSEAATLEWKHVHFDQGVIILPEHKTIRMQKSPVPRVIPLHPRVVRLLKQIPQQRERVFVTHRLTPWNKNTLAQRVKRARKVAGVPDDAKLYGVRHAFGTRAVVNGVPLKTLSALMGHTTTRMSEHYVHLAGQYAHLAAAMLQVNAHH